MNRPTVSVIVPCYNYGHFLEGCVTSVLHQEEVDVRLLVIDDCSTDDSASVGRDLAERHDRVEFRHHQENMGLIPTANEGLQWAQGEYVVLLSADDLLLPESLHRATTVMSRHPNVGMVYGRVLRALEGQPMPERSGRWRATKIWSGADWIRLRCRSGYNCIASPEVVVRTSIQQSVGGYDAACYHTSDLNMWLRIAAVADIAHIRGAAQAIYRVHADSMWRSHDGPMVDLREHRAAFESFFAACAPKLDEPDRLQALAARSLARRALWRASRAVDRGREDGLIEQLSGFALDIYPDTPRLREWRGLRLRQRIGAGRSLAFPPLLATGVAHRLRRHADGMRLKFKGI
jgi:hypothetical protein